MTRFVPPGVLRLCWMAINLAMMLYIYRFMMLHQMENNRNFRLIWFANTIVTGESSLLFGGSLEFTLVLAH